MPIDIKKVSGLSSQEVAIKLASHGFNELPAATSSYIVIFVLKLFCKPMFLLLLVVATLYFILGSQAESLMLLNFAVVIMGISCYQEYRSEKALITLRNLSSPRAFVIRDGQGKRIAGREVVPEEDITVLREVDVIPADARLLAVTNLLVDESILTGESDPVRKVDTAESALTTMVRPGGDDDLPFVYA